MFSICHLYFFLIYSTLLLYTASSWLFLPPLPFNLSLATEQGEFFMEHLLRGSSEVLQHTGLSEGVSRSFRGSQCRSSPPPSSQLQQGCVISHSPTPTTHPSPSSPHTRPYSQQCCFYYSDCGTYFEDLCSVGFAHKLPFQAS